VKRNIIRLLALLLLCVMCIPAALADEPLYRSYAYTPDGHPFYMQTPYEPVAIIGQYLYAESGEQIKGLNAPSDMCMAEDGTIYIADRGNKRIVQMTLDGVLLREIGVGNLKTPEGVYVDGDGTIYVADSGNANIVIFNADGSVRTTLVAPNDVRLTGIMFTPMKIMVDDRGYIYTLLKGSNEGLMVMSPDGKFQGYFGRNATQMTFGERIKRIFYTDKQIETNSNAVAPSITGMCVSKNGFIYTTTANLKSLQIKKFNANGDNIFANVQTQVVVDRRTDALQHRRIQHICAVTVADKALLAKLCSESLHRILVEVQCRNACACACKCLCHCAADQTAGACYDDDLTCIIDLKGKLSHDRSSMIL